jgi:SpoVK/Ycf46/Vps4 family AAA+-type ATPase
MLTQMENYSGVFIATTNLMGGLDQAALRRFDLKVKFDYLKSDQVWGMFTSHCTALSIPGPDSILKQQLDTMENVTPGDFAAINRRNRFQPIKSGIQLLEALKVECSLKESAPRRAIGFQW